MRSMRSVTRSAALLALALALAACTGSPVAMSGASPLAGGTPAASPAAHGTQVAPKSPAPPTAAASRPAATPVGTTQTAWGRILDAVPATFPVFPAAKQADAPPDAAVSGIWVSKATVTEVATWYRDALVGAHFAKVDLGSALEDGSRVLDIQGGLPECKAQVSVKPQGGSTMISVLFGAGCAGGSG